jgi:hypothetical protein
MVGTGHPSVPTTSWRAVRHRGLRSRVVLDDAPVIVRCEAERVLRCFLVLSRAWQMPV